MWFITDTPTLFNVETGIVVEKQFVSENSLPDQKVVWEVIMGSKTIHMGTHQECQDFIYSIGGWVGAVNPLTLERIKNGS